MGDDAGATVDFGAKSLDQLGAVFFEDGHLGDIPRITVAAFTKNGFAAQSLRFRDELIQRRTDGAIRIDGQNSAIHDAQGGRHRKAGVLIDERLAFFKGCLGVVINDDPKNIAL